MNEQKALLKFWQMYGLHPHYLAMHWGDGEPFQPKFDRILSAIDELHNHGHKVSLVGSSAGASAVLNAYAKRKKLVTGVVYICGKVKNEQSINERVYKRNPAFRESLAMLPDSLKALEPKYRNRILSIRPLRDGLVPVADTKIDGVREKTFTPWAMLLVLALR
jgi:pimeloyl-ACP methyl ester carboxylesterase